MDYKSFKDRIRSDKAFSREFEGIEEVKELIAAAKKMGYSFTEEDVRNESILDETELASVAGGGVIQPADQVVNNYTPSIMGSGNYIPYTPPSNNKW